MADWASSWMVKNETFYKEYKKYSDKLDKDQSEVWSTDFMDTLEPVTFTNTELSAEFRKEFNTTAAMCYTLTKKKDGSSVGTYKFIDYFKYLVKGKVDGINAAISTNPIIDSMQLIVTRKNMSELILQDS
jgi:hypothetical protein